MVRSLADRTFQLSHGRERVQLLEPRAVEVRDPAGVAELLHGGLELQQLLFGNEPGLVM